MNPRSVVTAAFLVAMVCVTGAIAARSAVSLTVSPSSVQRGHVVIIRGNAGGCPVGDAVTIISRAFKNTQSFAGVPAVFARVRTGGKFGIRPRIPANRHVGRYAITARCGGGNLGVTAHVTVRS
jgi:hypothetical protein